MELSDLWRTLTRQWVIGILVLVLVGSLGAAAALLPEESYRSSATVVLDLGTDDDSSMPIQQVNFLLPSLQEWAVSRRLRTDAAELVPEAYRNESVAIDAELDQSVLRIGATAASPESAQAWANATAEQLIVSRSGAGSIDLVLLDEAPLRNQPVAPQVVPILIGTLAVALIAAVFAALLADRLRSAYTTRQAVRERLGSTVLGEIPRMTRAERRNSVVGLMGGGYEELISAFESIRINIEFRLAERSESAGSRIAVVSLEREAGKTMIAAGLSCAIAKVNRDVVAVEADLRRPSLAEQLEAFRGHGLGDIAAERTEVAVLQATPYPRLKMLSAGIPVGRPADVVATALPAALDGLDRPGRMIIIDSPPLRGAPESAIVVSEARNVILVVGTEHADLDDLSETVAQINEAGGVLLGIVINRVSRRRIRKSAYGPVEDRGMATDDVMPELDRPAPIR